MSGYLTSQTSGSVMTMQCSAYKEQVAKSQNYISTLIDLILFLGKQGMAYRGHREDIASLNQGIVCVYYYLIYCFIGNNKLISLNIIFLIFLWYLIFNNYYY